MNHKSHRWELNPRPLGDCDSHQPALHSVSPLSEGQFARNRRPKSPRIPFANDTQTTPMASAGVRNRRGEALWKVLWVTQVTVFVLGLLVIADQTTKRVAALEARATTAETKLRAVTWLAERRLDPAAVRADSLRRACYAQVARNGGADCGL